MIMLLIAIDLFVNFRLITVVSNCLLRVIMPLIINLVNKFLQMILSSSTNESNEEYFWWTTIDFIHREGDEIEEIDIYRNYYLVKNL